MKYALRVKLDTDAPQVALLPPPGVRRIEFTILMNWSTARTRSWGTLCACAARVQDAKPLQARLTGLGAHDTQVVPVGAQYRP
jgi:hypothetical protein